MKRYKLLKDLPFAKAGEILRLFSDGTMAFVDNPSLPQFNKQDVEMFPLWFEEINTGWITYWYITDLGQIFRASVHVSKKDNPITNANRKIGNYFQTEEEAKKHLKWLKARAVLLEDAKGYRFDPSKENVLVEYDHTWGKFLISSSFDRTSGQVFFKTEKDAFNSIEAHEKEWKIYSGVEDE